MEPDPILLLQETLRLGAWLSRGHGPDLNEGEEGDSGGLQRFLQHPCGCSLAVQSNGQQYLA